MTGQMIRWLALGYSVPASPSRARVYVWRRLHEYGAEYFKSGMAILPNRPENLKHFTELAPKIKELGGEAWIVELNFVQAEDDRRMESRFSDQAQNDSEELLQFCRHMLEGLKNYKKSPPLRLFKMSELKCALKMYRRIQNAEPLGSGISAGLQKELTRMAEETWTLPGTFLTEQFRRMGEGKNLLFEKPSDDRV